MKHRLAKGYTKLIPELGTEILADRPIRRIFDSEAPSTEDASLTIHQEWFIVTNDLDAEILMRIATYAPDGTQLKVEWYGGKPNFEPLDKHLEA